MMKNNHLIIIISLYSILLLNSVSELLLSTSIGS